MTAATATAAAATSSRMTRRDARKQKQQHQRRLSWLQCFMAATVVGTAIAFAPSSSSSSSSSTVQRRTPYPPCQHHRRFNDCSILPRTNIVGGYPSLLRPSPSTPPRYGRSTELHSFMGSDGGLLGIGTPELFTILLVGYFVLGPSDLYKLVKEIGKFVQNIRTFATEATDSLETNFESQLQLEEIRKAQRELNEAFSFRRSINVEADSDPFEVNAQSERGGGEYDLSTSTTMAASATTATVDGDSATAAATGPPAPGAPKKKIRRRVKRKKVAPATVEVTEPDAVSAESRDVSTTATTTTTPTDLASNVPDLNVEDEDDLELSQVEEQAFESMRMAQEELKKEQDEEEQTREKLRAERLQRLESGQPTTTVTTTANGSSEKDAAAVVAEQSRFQQQLSGNWNDQILDKGDTLEPLAGIMERLALLEEEKDAADRRLQEEFKLREENEERYYREKRALLEEAAAQIQADAYNLPSLSTSSQAKMATTTSSDAVSGSKS